MGTFSVAVTLPLHVCLRPKWGSTHKEKNLLLCSKFFPLRVDPILEGFVFQESKQTVIEVGLILDKSRKHRPKKPKHVCELAVNFDQNFVS